MPTNNPKWEGPVCNFSAMQSVFVALYEFNYSWPFHFIFIPPTVEVIKAKVSAFFAVVVST